MGVAGGICSQTPQSARKFHFGLTGSNLRDWPLRFANCPRVLNAECRMISGRKGAYSANFPVSFNGFISATLAIGIWHIWPMANLANLKGGPAKTQVWRRFHPVCRNSGSWGGALPRPGGPIYFPPHHRPKAKLVSGRQVLAFF